MSKPDGDKVVIVRRRPDHQLPPRHDGSWKVAYADFVTALMAFFLLMWLLVMLEPDQRNRLADFFTEYNLLQTLRGQHAPASRPQPETTAPPAGPATASGPHPGPGPAVVHEATPEEISERRAAAIESRLADVKDQVLIERDAQGVRIEVVDREGRVLFQRGDAEPTGAARRVLRVLGETLAGFDNKLSITGHADAIPFSPGSRHTNWELSVSRALAARRELDAAGFDPGRLERISGAAEVDPLIRDNPRDPRNRRISLRVLSGAAPAANPPGPARP